MCGAFKSILKKSKKFPLKRKILIWKPNGYLKRKIYFLVYDPIHINLGVIWTFPINNISNQFRDWQLIESSKRLSLSLPALSSKLGLVYTEIQAWSSKSGSECYDLKHLNLSFWWQSFHNRRFFSSSFSYFVNLIK